MIAIRTFVLVTASILFVGCGGEDTAPSSSESSGQRVAVAVNASGYEPSEVHARAGEPITLVFTRTTEEGCGDQVAIPSENITRDLPVNQPVEVTFTPREAGRLRFTCGMDMFDGAIVVE